MTNLEQRQAQLRQSIASSLTTVYLNRDHKYRRKLRGKCTPKQRKRYMHRLKRAQKKASLSLCKSFETAIRSLGPETFLNLAAGVQK